MSQHFCPICACTRFIEVNLHSDGFSSLPVEECGTCGCVWAYSKGKTKILAATKSFEMYKKNESYTKYASFSDEFVAEDQKVWFS